MQKLRYAVIGAGNIARTKHLPGYAALGDRVEVVAACDINPQVLSGTADAFNIPVRETDYRRVLAREDIDLVSVCTPNDLHEEITVAALEHGKHVHCEKPMAISLASAERMRDTARRTGRQLMVGLNNRYRAQVQYALSYVRSGALGEVYYAKCGWRRRAIAGAYGWFTDRRRSGGGPLIDLGVHMIDLALYLMDYPRAETVVANTFQKLISGEQGYLFTHDNSRLQPGQTCDVEDLAVGHIGFPGGRAMGFEISWASHIEKEEVYCQLYGTRGGLRLSNDGGNFNCKIFSVVNGAHADILPQVKERLFAVNEFQDFVDSVLSGRPSAISSLDQHVEMLGLIGDIYRSAETGRQVIR